MYETLKVRENTFFQSAGSLLIFESNTWKVGNTHFSNLPLEQRKSSPTISSPAHLVQMGEIGDPLFEL